MLNTDERKVVQNAVDALTGWMEKDFKNSDGYTPMWNPTLRTLRNLLTEEQEASTPQPDYGVLFRAIVHQGNRAGLWKKFAQEVIKELASAPYVASESTVVERDKRIAELSAELAALQQAWASKVGDGTDKITPGEIVSLIDDYQDKLAEGRTERDRLLAQVQRLIEPVSDEEWTYRYDADCDREYIIREDVDEIIATRKAKPRSMSTLAPNVEAALDGASTRRRGRRMNEGIPGTLIQERSWEFSLAGDYETRIQILRSWALEIERLIMASKVDGNKRLLRMVRMFYIAASELCRWTDLKVERATTLGIIRQACLRCAGLV